MSADRMIPNRDWSRGSSNGALGRVVAHTSPTAANTNGWVIFVANSRAASRVTGGRATSESPWAWLTAHPIVNDKTIAASDSPLRSSKNLSGAFLIILVLHAGFNLVRRSPDARRSSDREVGNA